MIFKQIIIIFFYLNHVVVKFFKLNGSFRTTEQKNLNPNLESVKCCEN